MNPSRLRCNIDDLKSIFEFKLTGKILNSIDNFFIFFSLQGRLLSSRNDLDN